MYNDTSLSQINVVMQQAQAAFHRYRKCSLAQRAHFLRCIARALENSGDELIHTAMQESHLPEARLRNERGRTVFQLTSYADACERGAWLDVRIDTALPDRNPPRPDIRKTMVPLGPVVVFGSSNFPFAFSTAGGDTACALAAGCPVVVKAHPGHAQTSTLVAALISRAAAECGLPEGVFAHVYGASFDVGEALVKHPMTKAVGFTGSYKGGKQLFDWGAQRREPIPVFAEMGSINPVFLLPQKLQRSAAELAKAYAASITLGVGQFCTNPGLLLGIEGADLQLFMDVLATEIQSTAPGTMLHPGIARAYSDYRERALSQEEVAVLAESGQPAAAGCGSPTIATVTAAAFLRNEVLQQEVFGPYSLVVRCAHRDELLAVARHLEGQLTGTLMATPEELPEYSDLADLVQERCGRLILNGVPTGVEVCWSMQHGGPFPASTDPRFTAVGADGIKRFVRPVAFQNWPDELLPEELQNDNPLQLYRTVNNEVTRGKIEVLASV
ncbi:aldehyde dehydrogenase (NADP(+)) [Paraflavisolibacter sp. H34]|uniref:aldehyde dehydrogenase (NADP(+)) n=1 Tax=Huijunlia imazamoxiresistens TaxID=3127457 RepID=UPI0030180E44